MEARKRAARFVIPMASGIKGMPKVEWVIECDQKGVTAHRKGEQGKVKILWRTLLGIALVHGVGKE